MEQFGLVSIVLPTFNSELYIKRTIDSILSQTYSNWELLIVDDASNDRTVKIIMDYVVYEVRIRLFRFKKNSGVAVARNKGLDLAKGDFIAFIDSDDVWYERKLEKQLVYMKLNNSSFCHTSYSFLDEDGSPLNVRTKCNKWINLSDLLRYNWIGTSTVIYSVKLLGKNKFPDLRNRQDWAFWLILIRKAGLVLFLDLNLTAYRIRKNSISSNKVRLLKYHWVIYRKVVGFNFFKSCVYFIRNLFYHLMKVKFVKDEKGEQ